KNAHEDAPRAGAQALVDGVAAEGPDEQGQSDRDRDLQPHLEHVICWDTSRSAQRRDFLDPTWPRIAALRARSTRGCGMRPGHGQFSRGASGRRTERYNQPRRRKYITRPTAIRPVTAIDSQNRGSDPYGMKLQFWPKKPVTTVRTRRTVAMLVRTFMTSFSRFEAAARYASMTFEVSSRNVSISSVTRRMWS